MDRNRFSIWLEAKPKFNDGNKEEGNPWPIWRPKKMAPQEEGRKQLMASKKTKLNVNESFNVQKMDSHDFQLSRGTMCGLRRLRNSSSPVHVLHRTCYYFEENKEYMAPLCTWGWGVNVQLRLLDDLTSIMVPYAIDIAIDFQSQKSKGKRPKYVA